MYFTTSAQTPQKFGFQGVARDATGKVLPAGSVISSLRFIIHKSSASGQTVFDETHSNVTVASGGVFNVAVGGGDQINSGVFNTIEWGLDSYYLQVQLDLGSGNIHDLGSVQLLSVPYANHAVTSESWRHNEPVVQTGIYNNGNSLSAVGDGSRLIWYPRKAAFCAGYTLNTIWNDLNIGAASVSMGSQTRAKANGSVAMGFKSYADGPYSVAMGEETMASGQSAFAFGKTTYSKAFGSATFGAFNDVQDNPAGTSAGASGFDRIFQVGNGSSSQFLSNAITILRNGNIGIGNNVLAPAYRLDVGGRARIHHSINTAGIHFDNSSHVPAGFIGMVNDNKVGLYMGNKWLLQVADNGNTGVGAAIDSPEHTLDVAGRARIRHIGATAGIHFDNSAGEETGFVGMVNDNKVGLFMGGKWAFQVSDKYAISAGTGNTTYGTNAVAFGSGAWAEGDESFAMGNGVIAKAWSATTIGAWNNVQDNPIGTKAGLQPHDRIFQIGNGVAYNGLSNAVTVLRNGNVGIGNDALSPTHILEVGGRARMRHSYNTAGIYFDNSQDNPVGFTGMSGDNSIGFFIGNQWKFQVYGNGGALIEGNLGVNGIISESSDRRLKRDLSPLSPSLRKLTDLSGYHYYWKDKGRDQSLQTGLIAQEVEELFPELVKTDEKGFKSLNYTGLIPHLIESVKELARQNSKLEGENVGFKAENKAIHDALALLTLRIDQLTAPASGEKSK
nr:tail fiber domain-containing protein [uncultured Dyadobacter sp.]